MNYLYKSLPKIEAESVDNALEVLNCQYKAIQAPLSYSFDGEDRNPPYHAAVIASDNGDCLGVHSSRYGILQFDESLSFLNSLMSDESKHKIIIERGVTTYNRARIYLVLRSEEKYALSDVEAIHNYFVVSTTHDGSGTLNILNTPVHESTQQELRSVITPMGKGLIKIRHSHNAAMILQRTRNIVDKVYTEWQENIKTFRLMANSKISDEDAKELIFKKVVEGNSTRADNIRAKMFDIFSLLGAAAKIPSCQSTIFGCYMAVVQYADQFKTVRASSKGLSTLESRVESSLNGAAAEDKAKAYKISRGLAMGRKMFEMAQPKV